jgi:hypothetical protein
MNRIRALSCVQASLCVKALQTSSLPHNNRPVIFLGTCFSPYHLRFTANILLARNDVNKPPHLYIEFTLPEDYVQIDHTCLSASRLASPASSVSTTVW